MENGYTTERPTRPLCKVRFKFWINCLEKWTGERDLERGTDDGTLSFEVDD